jgi:formate dehydrogenase subunit delta
MDLDNLIVMANQIGDFFGSLPDHEEALNSIADHIRKFWAPRMRAGLLRALDTPESAALSPIVLEALTLYRERLEPANA